MERKEGVGGGSEINRGLASFHGYSKTSVPIYSC